MFFKKRQLTILSKMLLFTLTLAIMTIANSDDVLARKPSPTDDSQNGNPRAGEVCIFCSHDDSTSTPEGRDKPDDDFREARGYKGKAKYCEPTVSSVADGETSVWNCTRYNPSGKNWFECSEFTDLYFDCDAASGKAPLTIAVLYEEDWTYDKLVEGQWSWGGNSLWVNTSCPLLDEVKPNPYGEGRTFHYKVREKKGLFALTVCTPSVDDGDDNPHCTVYVYGEKHTHSYGAWKVTKEATCTATGIETRTCSCGASETRTIPMKSHSYTLMSVI